MSASQEPIPAGSVRSPGLGARTLNGFLRFREASIVFVAVLLIIYFEISNSNFITDANLQTLSQFIAAPVIIACGEIMLLICGEIDLSAGMVFALAPFIMVFGTSIGLPTGLALILALIVAGCIGFINGFITVKLRVPSFVTTLGTLFLINGLTLTISKGFPVDTPGSKTFASVMGNWGYSEILWAVAIVAVMHIVLRQTRWGLHTVAVGGNVLAAAESGINVPRVKIGNFVLTSALAAFAGIVEAYRIGSSDPLAGGTNMMFLAVAASVIGGTSLMGGSGTIIGGLIGGLVLGVLQDGFTIDGINAYAFDMIIGGAILIAMVFNIHVARLRRSGRRV